MSHVAPIDRATEDRVQRALTCVADYVDRGDDPTDAMCKAATDHGLSRGLVQLAVNAYNTGRMLQQFDRGNNVEEKLASFPLARLDDVLSRLYPSNVKTAAEEARETAIDPAYFSPPSWVEEEQQRARGVKAAAVLEVARKEFKQASVDELQESTVRWLQGEVAEGRRNLANAEQEVQRTKTAACLTYGELTDFFSRSASPPSLSLVTKYASAVLGPGVVPLLKAVGEDVPQTQKTAAMPHEVQWNAAPYSLLKDCLEAATEMVAAETKLAEAKDRLENRSVLLRSLDAQPAPVSYRTGFLFENEKTAAGLGAGVGMGVGAKLMDSAGSFLGKMLPSAPDEEAEIEKQLAKLQDPKHEQAIRRIRTQTMLSDLMQHDPVISAHPRPAVLDGYSRLSELAPTASQRRLPVQAALRKLLEQGSNLETFDLDQLVQLDRKLSNKQEA